MQDRNAAGLKRSKNSSKAQIVAVTACRTTNTVVADRNVRVLPCGDSDSSSKRVRRLAPRASLVCITQCDTIARRLIRTIIYLKI